MNNLPPLGRPRKPKSTLNPFIPPKPLTISRARKVMTTLAWRGVETPISLLVELTGFNASQIREVLANTDILNEYLDTPILVRKKTSINGHQYYLATVGQPKQKETNLETANN
jgi:hypothetical protein